MNRKYIISMEGNIGSGKSTLIKKLQDINTNIDLVFLDEPVDEWVKIKDDENNDILSKFYKDQKKYAFPFQMMAYISRLEKLKTALKTEHNYIFTERSLSTDKYVFAQMLYDGKIMGSCEYQIYNKWFDSFNSDTAITHIVYVKTDPIKCYDRIATRSRNGESNIEQEYLNTCHTYHEQMIKTQEQNNIPVLTLDGNRSIFDKPVLDKWLDDIHNFIKPVSSDTVCNSLT